MRDTILAISGRLDSTAVGRALSRELCRLRIPDDSTRRSVYIPAFRNALPQIFELFDFADTSVVTGNRHASIVAPQALYFLNHPFVAENARAAAAKNKAGSVRDQISHTYRETLGRRPTESELKLVKEQMVRKGKLARIVISVAFCVARIPVSLLKAHSS